MGVRKSQTIRKQLHFSVFSTKIKSNSEGNSPSEQKHALKLQLWPKTLSFNILSLVCEKFCVLIVVTFGRNFGKWTDRNFFFRLYSLSDMNSGLPLEKKKWKSSLSTELHKFLSERDTRITSRIVTLVPFARRQVKPCYFVSETQ